MQTIDGGRASDPKPTQNTLEEVGALSWLFISKDVHPLKASLLSQTVLESDVRRWGGQQETTSATVTGSGELQLRLLFLSEHLLYGSAFSNIASTLRAMFST